MPNRIITLLCLAVALMLAFVSSGAQAAVMSIDYGTEWFKVGLIKPGIPLDVALNKDSKRKTQAMVTLREDQRLYGSDSLALVNDARWQVLVPFHWHILFRLVVFHSRLFPTWRTLLANLMMISIVLSIVIVLSTIWSPILNAVLPSFTWMTRLTWLWKSWLLISSRTLVTKLNMQLVRMSRMSSLRYVVWEKKVLISWLMVMCD